jgi:hypothetical protein
MTLNSTLNDKINNIENISLNRISVLIISISLILWSISLHYSKLQIGSYGLIHGLNPLFFVAIGLLTISTFINIKYNAKSDKLIITHIFIIALFTLLIPILMEGTPRFPYNLQTAQNVDYIIQYAHSNDNLMQYQAWPGVFYFDALIVLISNVSPFNSILIIPLILNSLIALPLYYLFYSTFLNKKETLIVLLLTTVLFFGSPIYLLPGVLAGFMANFALLVFFRSEFNELRDSQSIRIIFIIFCAATIVSHFLSSVYLLMSLIFISTLIMKHKRYLDNKFILLFVLIVLWQIYVAGSYAIDQIVGSVHTVLNLESTLAATKSAAFGGSNTHTQIIYVKIISILMLIFLASLGLFYEIFWKRKLTLKDLALPTWISANFSITLLTSYSGEILSRTFAASIIPLYMLAGKTLKNNKLSLILLVVLLIAPPLSIINAYGNEAVDYISPIEITGANFLFDYHENNSIVKSLGERVFISRYSNNFKDEGYPTNIHISLEKIIPINQRKLFNSFYILVGKNDIDQYTFLYSDKQFDLSFLKDIDNSQKYNKIYDAPGFTLYYLKGIK